MEAIMEFDAWHHWLLLRPLIIFVLACPLLILAVLLGRRRDRRDAERTEVSEPTTDRGTAGPEDAASRGYEVASSVGCTPRQWDNKARSTRRAA